MGERLNIEIQRSGKVLANSYFHWYGYTEPAFILTKQILGAVGSVDTTDPFVEAIKLLETTSAGFLQENLLYLKERYPDIEFKKAVNRNEGFILIQPDEIERNRTKHAEHHVEIDLDTRLINFGAIVVVVTKDEYEEDNYLLSFNEILPSKIDFSKIPFDNIELLEKTINLMTGTKQDCYFRYNDTVIFAVR